MKLLPVLLGAVLSVGSLSAGPAPAAPAIMVEFVRPERFVDVQQSSTSREMSRDVLLPDLRNFLIQQGETFLPAGSTLKIFITDIDDAGQISHHPSREIRVVSQSFPARIDFNWELRDAQGRVQRGRERLVQRAGEAGERPDFLGSMPTVKYAMQRWLRQAVK